MNNPCYDSKTKTDCKDRCAGCAGSCAKWKEYETKKLAEIDARNKLKYADFICKRTIGSH